MTISKCIPVLDHFLCGYSLQIGTIFTGWLGLVSHLRKLIQDGQRSQFNLILHLIQLSVNICNMLYLAF